MNPEAAEVGNTSAAKIQDTTPISPRKNHYEHDSR